MDLVGTIQIYFKLFFGNVVQSRYQNQYRV